MAMRIPRDAPAPACGRPACARPSSKWTAALSGERGCRTGPCLSCSLHGVAAWYFQGWNSSNVQYEAKGTLLPRGNPMSGAVGVPSG